MYSHRIRLKLIRLFISGQKCYYLVLIGAWIGANQQVRLAEGGLACCFGYFRNQGIGSCLLSCKMMDLPSELQIRRPKMIERIWKTIKQIDFNLSLQQNRSLRGLAVSLTEFIVNRIPTFGLERSWLRA